jgi:hypothetical protein
MLSYRKNSTVLYFIICLLSAAFTLASCGGGGGSATTTGSLSIINSTSKNMTEVYLAETSSAYWGTNHLSSSIASGDSVLLTDIPTGTYDCLAVFTDSYSTYYAYATDFPITDGQTYTLTAYDSSLSGSIKIANNHASLLINRIYIITDLATTPSPGDASWGTPVFDTPMSPGASLQFIGMVPGNYDVWIEMSDGTDFVNTNTYPNSTPITSGQLFTITVQ